METKSGNENALTALRQSTKDLKLTGKVYSLDGSKHYAVFEASL